MNSTHPPRYCRATLNYSDESDRVPLEVDIHDARAVDDPDFESRGFRRIDHVSAVTDWRDEDHLGRVHAPEIEALARQATGAEAVLVYPPIVRSPGSAARIQDYAPIEFVHSDFTDDFRSMLEDPGRPYARFFDPLLERAGLGRDDILRAERVVMLQFWRNIGDEHPDFPLALCDAATVPRSDLRTILVSEYGGRHLEFETFAVRPPEQLSAHHWYTCPGLGIDEAVMFRTYDSRRAARGLAFWTPHSAFRDPHAGANAPRRESVEMRALCLVGS